MMSLMLQQVALLGNNDADKISVTLYCVYSYIHNNFIFHLQWIPFLKFYFTNAKIIFLFPWNTNSHYCCIC